MESNLTNSNFLLVCQACINLLNSIKAKDLEITKRKRKIVSALNLLIKNLNDDVIFSVNIMETFRNLRRHVAKSV